MVDTLQTAATSNLAVAGRALGNSISAAGEDACATADFDVMVADWGVLAEAMNNLNRSMGLDDAYPFALSGAVIEKLRFVHDLVRSEAPA